MILWKTIPLGCVIARVVSVYHSRRKYKELLGVIIKIKRFFYFTHPERCRARIRAVVVYADVFQGDNTSGHAKYACMHTSQPARSGLEKEKRKK